MPGPGYGQPAGHLIGKHPAGYPQAIPLTEDAVARVRCRLKRDISDFMTRSGPFVNANMTAGVLITTLYELDNAKLAEGLDFLGNYVATYFGIPGFKYEFKPHFTVEEGLRMLGM